MNRQDAPHKIVITTRLYELSVAGICVEIGRESNVIEAHQEAIHVIIAAHHPQFLPYVGFPARLLVADRLVLLDDLRYPTRNREQFKNRNRIRVPGGWAWITVPTRVKGRRGQLISEVEIDNTQKWARKLTGRIAHCYCRAAYFPQYEPFLRKTFRGRIWARLIDLNLHLLHWLLGELQFTDKVVMASELNVIGSAAERIVGFCQQLAADQFLAGPMEIERLSAGDQQFIHEAGIGMGTFQFECPRYRQCWSPFEENLSTLDLLLNEGPRSREILAEGVKARDSDIRTTAPIG